MDKENMDFWNLYMRLLQYPLSAREMNYLIWRFFNRKRDKEIARLDGRRIGKSAVNLVLNNAYRKIKLYKSKS